MAPARAIRGDRRPHAHPAVAACATAQPLRPASRGGPPCRLAAADVERLPLLPSHPCQSVPLTYLGERAGSAVSVLELPRGNRRDRGP